MAGKPKDVARYLSTYGGTIPLRLETTAGQA